MISKLTHTQRLRKILCGETADRPLCSAWGHMMNLHDRNAAEFAEATIKLQDAADFDFIKVMSNPYYLIEDIGPELIAPKRPQDCVSRSSKLPICTPKDWRHLSFPNVNSGSLLREQDAIDRIVSHYQGDVPVIATIFTPIMWLSYLAITSEDMERSERTFGSSTHTVKTYLLENETYLMPALQRLHEINLEYMETLLNIGVTGFFYCTEHANDTWGDVNMFQYFEGRFDLEALQSVNKADTFNILHVCGKSNLRMDYILDYPVHALNWEDSSPYNLSLRQIRELSDKVLIGGLDRMLDLKGSEDIVRQRLLDRLAAAVDAAGSAFILSGGCDWKYEDAQRLPLICETVEKYVK